MATPGQGTKGDTKMKLWQFCELTMQNLAIEKQTDFSIRVEAHHTTLFAILNTQRFIYKWTGVPYFLCLFFLTKLGLLKPPPSRLEELRALKGQTVKAQKPVPEVKSEEKPNAEVLPDTKV